MSAPLLKIVDYNYYVTIDNHNLVTRLSQPIYVGLEDWRGVQELMRKLNVGIANLAEFFDEDVG